LECSLRRSKFHVQIPDSADQGANTNVVGFIFTHGYCANLLMPKTEPGGTEISFEAAMERLEKIVGEMESSKLPLEDLLVRYEEGIRLVGICNQRLAGAEIRIETLSRTTNGKEQPSGAATAQDSMKDPNKIKNEEIRLF
jgi:exodeoxyribonuclease VII small subunit